MPHSPTESISSSNIVLDGNLDDWSLLYRVHPPIWEHSKSYDFGIYGMHDAQSKQYYFALERTDNGTIEASTTIYLDTNRSSFSNGAHHGMAVTEYYIDFVNHHDKEATLIPHLYKAKPWAWLGPIDHSYHADQKVVEIAIPASAIDSIGDIFFFVDINDAFSFPNLFSAPWYTATSFENLPPQHSSSTAREYNDSTSGTGGNNIRVALFFSRESEAAFYGGGQEYTYRQLYASMQHQLFMAGLPYDLLYVEELADLETILRYNALVFPYNDALPELGHENVLRNLKVAVHNYGIGLIVGDKLFTQVGAASNPSLLQLSNPYRIMWELLGVTVSGYGAGDFTVKASNVNHPILDDYYNGETLLHYQQGFYNHYTPMAVPGVFVTSSNITVLAEVHTEAHVHNAVLAVESTSGARHVHFATCNIMADGNLLWKALQWVVFGDDAIPVGLKLSRQKSVFSARNDMDISMFHSQLEEITLALLEEYLRPWKQMYNFVGTYFVNIGNKPNVGENTNWSVSRPLYRQYMEEGNEIGSHTYTHPMHIADLTEEELVLEFQGSGAVLEAELGLMNIGYAQPGNPEDIRTVKLLDAMGLYYFSGTYTGVGIGFPSAFGFLSPEANMGFMAPNMFSDYNLMEFKQLTVTEATATWMDQFDTLLSHANTPIVHYHWHDYGPMYYSPALIEDIIRMAYMDDSEFISNKDLFERIKQMKTHELHVSNEGGGLVIATVSGSGSFGHLALDVSCRKSEMIENVENWYAYNDKKVFLPSNGGSFAIRKGTIRDINNTRIIYLPMRAELVSVTGDGQLLQFSFKGNGTVVVQLNAEVAYQLEGVGATTIKEATATTLEMTFDSVEPLKTGSVTWKRY